MKYYSSKFYWFRENGILPNTTNIFRHPNFIRLDFPNLKVEETGVYKCKITDDTNLQEKRFQLIVFGKWFGFFEKISKICSFGLRSYDILLFLRKFLAFLTQILLMLWSPDHFHFPQCYTVIILYSLSILVFKISKIK